ncbi:hypothetical protein H8E88_01755 [candidate division KSB1 bacterium]|nr:hypothetical protein [candidate division KSB1 bacterium]
MSPDVETIYKILVGWAINTGPQYYKNLSEEYKNITGQWYEPHGSWDKPLGEINVRLSKIGAPAITVLVFLKGQNEPGGNFWGCAENVPSRPKDDSERISKVFEIVKIAREHKWPNSLP